MNLLVNGTCLSRGPGSWPYHLQNMLAADMVNLSLAGVGNTYIFESTLRELCRRLYDLVILTWTNSHHMPIRVDDISKFADSNYTSLHQSSVNDWPEKIVYPVNDQDYVEKNWILDNGFFFGANDSVSQIFEHYHGIVKFAQSLERDLTYIISLQSFLNVNGIPYVFLYPRKLNQFQRFDYLYQQIDWTKWYLQHDLKTISIQDDGRYRGDDGRYADVSGHRLYATYLYQFICDRIMPDLGTQSSGVNQDNLR